MPAVSQSAQVPVAQVEALDDFARSIGTEQRTVSVIATR